MDDLAACPVRALAKLLGRVARERADVAGRRKLGIVVNLGNESRADDEGHCCV